MSQEIATFPRRVGSNSLRQMKDVSSKQPVIGQALVYSAAGQWEPQDVAIDTNDIEADILELQTDVLAVQSDVVILQSDLNTAESAIDALESDVADLIVDVAALDTDISTHITNTSNPHSVTLAQTGSTVIDDTATPATDTNTADVLLDNLANRVKSITGESGWKSAPDTTLAVAASHIANTSNPHSVTFDQVATYQKVTLASDFSLGTTSADVTGMSLTLAAVGTYLVFIDVRCVYNAVSTGVETYLEIDGTEGPAHVWESSISDTVVISFVRVVVTTSINEVIQLRAAEKVSSNTVFDGTNTHMVSLKVA